MNLLRSYKCVSYGKTKLETIIYFGSPKIKKTLKKINELLRDIERNGNNGIGKPEPLKHNMSGWWSREIDKKNRLVYRIVDTHIEILQCKTHYNDT